jgi:AcrR family transcriptional regulator
VSDLPDRRARKKARTRAEIRQSAQELFAEHGFESVTIADIADAADVAVQTVFNHFPTKEELFFDGYTRWVDGLADAVRNRPTGMPPLAVVRAYSEGLIRTATERGDSHERRRYVATLNGSAALLAYELRLLERAEVRLREVLTEAWTTDPATTLGPAEIQVTASLTAALWISAGSALMRELRNAQLEGGDAAEVTEAVRAIADRAYDVLEAQTGAAARRARRRQPARQAG